MQYLKAHTYNKLMLEKFKFARRILPLLMVWILTAISIAVIGWGTFFSIQNTARKNAEEEALRDAASYANNHADRLHRTIDAIDQMMRHVQFEWALSDGRMKIDDIEKFGLFASPAVYYITIFNQDGIPVLTTLPELKIISVADQPYFIAQKTATSDFLYISPLSMGRASQINVIQLSRRLFDKENKFTGIVTFSAAATFFTANYDLTVLGGKGLLGFLSRDNKVMVTRIGNTTSSVNMPRLFVNPPFSSTTNNSFIEGKRFSDGRSRFVGWKDVRDYSLTAFAGLDAEEALAPYKYRYQSARQNTIWASMILASFTLLAMLVSIEMAWRKHQLSITAATYRLATEEGSEGIYIYQPVFDRSGAVIDFRITDCNHRAAEFFKLRREALINRTVSSFRTGINVQNFMHWLSEAWENGFYNGEVRVPKGSSLQISWAEIKILRSNELLAVRLRDISESKDHLSELERRSDEDALTGLPNRHWIQHYLPKAIARAAENKKSIALLFIDLDGFKKVNDTAGHAAGDEVLRLAAERLIDATRPDDKVVRFGGDEFVVILESVEGQSDGAHVAERIQQAFDQPFRVSNGTHPVGTSIGIALFPDDGPDAFALLEKADIAMYSVKTNGKHGYQYYEAKFYHALRDQLEKEAEIRGAIERDEFVMYYQPRVDTFTGVTTSLEALIRWQHPTKGLLEPREFIDLAEKTGLIIGIGELVIEKVSAQLSQWARVKRELVPVSVNVSPRQFKSTDIAEVVMLALSRHNLPGFLLELEITESSVMEEGIAFPAAFSKLQGVGIKILVDDFGTGYSSLSRLHQLDFDVLKVDQIFTAGIENSPEGRVFFTAIVTMAHALGMRVVAEGVENAAQVKILKSLLCDEIQGYYVSKPLLPGYEQPVLPKWFSPELKIL
jgi:diguanylate cyclase (GGDEF)-like protein